MARVIKTFDKSHPKRQNLRIGIPIRVVTEGQVLDGQDWSLGGFRTLTPNKLKLDDEIVISHFIFGDEEPVPVQERAKVVRHNPKTGEIGVRFQGLGDKAFKFIEKAMMRRKN